MDGDLVMNAFPHNAEPETMTPELFVAALNISRSIAFDLSISPPATLSQRDVPGLSRASIPLLKSKGVSAVSVGVNGASLPPAVPRAFVWRDGPSKEEVAHALDATCDNDMRRAWNVTVLKVLGMYHPRGYGGFLLDDAVFSPDGQQAFVTCVKDLFNVRSM